MKYIVKIFVIIFLINIANISMAETIIAYIDMEKIMLKSKAGKSIESELQKIHKNNIDSFKKTEESLKKQESQIIAQKNVMKKEDFQKKINELRKKAQEYQKSRREKNNDLTKKRVSATSQLLKSLNPILAEYSSDKSISIVIQKKNIVLGKSELDITEDILKLLDKKISKIKLN